MPRGHGRYALCNEETIRKLQNKIRVDKCPFFNLPAVGRNRCAQGLTAAEMKRCHWVNPVIVCQIKFTVWTRDDSLRQPVFHGIRKDKNANEVVRKKAN